MTTPFDPRDVEQGRGMRLRVKELLELAEKAEAVAKALASPVGSVLVELLSNQIEAWEKRYSWEPFDPLKQGAALRSREILNYLNNAPKLAQQHRDAAKKIVDALVLAEDAGRIPRVEDPR